ncbi:MAG: beta-glucosidase BglX [Robiginitomaculum sp.]
MNMMRGAAALIIGASLLACAPDTPSQSAEVKIGAQSVIEPEGHALIDGLIAQMTLEEKIGQMTLFSANWSDTGAVNRESWREDVKAGKVGAVFSLFTAQKTRAMQTIAVEQTRLGIPLLFGYDVIHGHRTTFPIPLAEAASWDLEAIELSARIAGREAAAEGLHWTFAPMVDIARDPRWGRIAEGAGEDVYLGSKIAAARVRGFQGDDLGAHDTILATAKHFAAYGAAQAGRDYHTTDMSQRELRETYFPPFEAALEAGAATLMTSFNALNGVPVTGSSFLLTDVLREEWGFEGFVVTDYTSINEMVPHGYSRDNKQAGEQSLNAGVDMDMQGAVFMTHLEQSIEDGAVKMAQIDTAVARILEMKYRLGLFDDPYRYSDLAREKAEIYSAVNIAAARDIARKSIVLLKNDNDVLPLSSAAQSIAIIGPLGDSKSDMLGNWIGAGDRKTRPVSLTEGLRARYGAGNVTYIKGADYTLGAKPNPDAIKQAVALAQKSDVIIAAMGERWSLSGEAASRTDLQLPGNQQALLEALVATGKPVILVLINGRPLALEWAQNEDNVAAIIEAWQPGMEGGHAIADILSGDYNPSGRLPLTVPRNVGQVPLYYNMLHTGRPVTDAEPNAKFKSRYLATPNTPLYAFGYGLSYTDFKYSKISLSADSLPVSGTLTASVTVTNSGKRAGVETVQLYIQDKFGSVVRPVKQLKGFEQITLDAGQSQTVSFTLTAKDLSFYRADMSFGAEAGAFNIFIGSASDNTRKAAFTLTD